MGIFLTVLFLATMVATLSVFLRTFKLLIDSKIGKDAEIDRYEQNHRRLWVMVFTGYTFILLSVYFVFALITPLPEPGKQEVVWNPMSAIFFLTLFHFMASFRIVRVTELGAVLFFGRELHQVSSGLRFVPWLVCELKKEQRTVFEDELPADPEKIYRSKLGEPDFVPAELLEKGYRPPLRVTFAGTTTEEKEGPGEQKTESGGGKDDKEKKALKKTAVDDPFEERLTVEVPGIVRSIRFRIVLGKSSIVEVCRAWRSTKRHKPAAMELFSC